MRGSGRLVLPPEAAHLLVGVGGVGTGLFFALEGNQTLGRNESRPAALLEVRDYCKLHVVSHYAAVLLNSGTGPNPVRVLPMARVGDDPQGLRLREEMEQVGIDTSFVRVMTGIPTLLSVCYQYPDGAGGNITTTNGAAAGLQAGEIEALAPILAIAAGRAVAVALPEVPLACRVQLLSLAGEYQALRVASFTSAELAEEEARAALALTDLLVINEDEAGRLADAEWDPAEPASFLDRLTKTLAALAPTARVVMSAGSAGAFAWEGGAWDHCPVPETKVASTAGAGDALTAGVLCGLLTGLPLTGGSTRVRFSGRPVETALDLGVLLASFSVTSPHTIHPEIDLTTLAEFAERVGPGFGARLTARCAWSESDGDR
ncbi:MAG: PfkB family carbohydrate kinase [Candidatus Latescibacterota bacterium]|jgi:sugar/nucleoside kinase (ribokinase family)